jgi:hypothetical protein
LRLAVHLGATHKFFWDRVRTILLRSVPIDKGNFMRKQELIETTYEFTGGNIADLTIGRATCAFVAHVDSGRIVIRHRG